MKFHHLAAFETSESLDVVDVERDTG